MIMNIRELHHLYRQTRWFKAWYFLIPAIIFGMLAVNGLRSNYSTMVTLRESVYKADEQNGDVETALNNLRSHVYSHMNTNLTSGSNPIKPPIQLKARYERLVAAEQERIKAQNAQVTAQGEQVCAAQFPDAGYNAPRVACVQEYVGVNGVKARDIPDQLYKFDFISPRWSPDLAGYSLIFSGLFIILFVTRVAVDRWAKRKFRN